MFQQTELSYILGKLYSEHQHLQNQKHIQNPSIFRTRDILRTLPKIYDGKFFKKQLLRVLSLFPGNEVVLTNTSLHFSLIVTCRAREVKSLTIKKFLIFQEMNFVSPKPKRPFIFQERILKEVAYKLHNQQRLYEQHNR